jgi:hypothetical protein
MNAGMMPADLTPVSMTPADMNLVDLNSVGAIFRSRFSLKLIQARIAI